MHRNFPKSNERRTAMYLTVKQQLKHLSKDDYKSLRTLCHTAKNLANQAIYNVRQYYFDEGEYLNYQKNYALLKNSDNYKMLNSNMAQQILKEVDGSFKSFFGLLKLAKKGKYSFDFYYSGDETFANGTYNDIIFSIPSFNTTIVPKIENFTIYYRNGTSFAITLLDDLGRPLKYKTVKFRINNQIYTRKTDLNGETKLAINLNPGDYLMEVAFDGFPAISGCSYNTTLTVLPTLKADDLVKIYKKLNCKK